MLLAVDVGNSNILFAIYPHPHPHAHAHAHDASATSLQVRLETSRTRPEDEYAALLLSHFAHAQIDLKSVTDVIIASVVPVIDRTLNALCVQLFGLAPTFVRATDDLGVRLAVDAPDSVGIDRVVNAVAAYERVHGACIVIDMGTATTFDCVSAQGDFLGGAIALGLASTAEALASRGAKLSRFPLTPPPRAIATNTTHAMQSGTLLGYASMVEGMVSRCKSEMSGVPRVFATGGLSGVVAPLVSVIDEVVPDLMLEGLRLLYLRRQTQTSRT
jgi:type III pantothenate kinase